MALHLPSVFELLVVELLLMLLTEWLPRSCAVLYWGHELWAAAALQLQL